MDLDAIWHRGRPRPRPVSSYDTHALFSDVSNRLLQRCVCHGFQVCHKLQQVLNAADPMVNGTKKFDRGLTQLLHAGLHWFDVPECIKCKLCMTMHQCQIGTAPVCDSTLSTSLGDCGLTHVLSHRWSKWIGRFRYTTVSVQRGGHFRYMMTSVHMRSISVRVFLVVRLRYMRSTISVHHYVDISTLQQNVCLFMLKVCKC